jgi:hypothetical protein
LSARIRSTVTGSGSPEAAAGFASSASIASTRRPAASDRTRDASGCCTGSVDTNPATSGRPGPTASSAPSVVSRSTSTSALGGATWSGATWDDAKAGPAPDRATTATITGTSSQRIPAS